VRHLTYSSPNIYVHAEVLAGIQRCRRWGLSENLRLVEETFLPGKNVLRVARMHGVAPNQLDTSKNWLVWARRRREWSDGCLWCVKVDLSASLLRFSGLELLPAPRFRAMQAHLAPR